MATQHSHRKHIDRWTHTRFRCENELAIYFLYILCIDVHRIDSMEMCEHRAQESCSKYIKENLSSAICKINNNHQNKFNTLFTIVLFEWLRWHELNAMPMKIRKSHLKNTLSSVPFTQHHYQSLSGTLVLYHRLSTHGNHEGIIIIERRREKDQMQMPFNWVLSSFSVVPTECIEIPGFNWIGNSLLNKTEEEIRERHLRGSAQKKPWNNWRV